MTNGGVKRSPFFYVGDKCRLMARLLELFPPKINNFYEPFVGGGTVFLNIKASRYFLNDINRRLVSIHEFLVSRSRDPENFFNGAKKIICRYNLSRSYAEDIVPSALKEKFKKTYYAKFNKSGYEELRKFANGRGGEDPLMLYILLVYGFNRMLRFNRAGKFNLPVGNVDFNKNVVMALNDYFNFTKNKSIRFASEDFRRFLVKQKYRRDDFVYLDPPYIVAASEYNKLWSAEADADLLDWADELNAKGVKFAMSNATRYNGNKNAPLIKWSGKYNVHGVRSNYINYRNNGQKEINEVLITNY
ncbi:MAG: Dam family site-specific DNA-(adenine-N6)-methyltransferase [Betaproteobacteria bacterium]|nr:Dam family site-specific DNA-(adenine-N6)-methyltransferase [Betaproteobacteria bacterium]